MADQVHMWDDDTYSGRLDLALWRRIAAHAKLRVRVAWS